MPPGSRAATGRAWLAGGARGHSPGTDRRAARLHAQPSGRGARPQPLDLHPARAALRRDDRDAVGSQADPGRRARAAARRTETSRQATPSAADSRPAGRSCPPTSSNESEPSEPKAQACTRSQPASTPTEPRPPTAARNGGPQPFAPPWPAQTRRHPFHESPSAYLRRNLLALTECSSRVPTRRTSVSGRDRPVRTRRGNVLEACIARLFERRGPREVPGFDQEGRGEHQPVAEHRPEQADDVGRPGPCAAGNPVAFSGC